MGSIIAIVFTLFSMIFSFANLLFGCGSKKNRSTKKVEPSVNTVNTIAKKEDEKAQLKKSVLKPVSVKEPSDMKKVGAENKSAGKNSKKSKKSDKNGSKKKEEKQPSQKAKEHEVKEPPKGLAPPPPPVNKPDSKTNIITDPIVTPETDEYPTIEEEKKTEEKPKEEVAATSNKDKKK